MARRSRLRSLNPAKNREEKEFNGRPAKYDEATATLNAANTTAVGPPLLLEHFVTVTTGTVGD